MKNSSQFHIDPSWVIQDNVCIPLGPLYRQMKSVLKLHTGDRVRCFDGIGGVVEGPIAHMNKDGVLVTIQDRYIQTKVTYPVLAIAILKNDRMKFVLEKATELGISTIIPMLTERTVKRPETVPSRWNHIVREAAEQSGHAHLPQISAVQEYTDIIAHADQPIVFHTEAVSTLNDVEHFHQPTLIIGPEGGLTDDEIQFAERHRATITTLGDFQLRADTAAITAISRISHLL